LTDNPSDWHAFLPTLWNGPAAFESSLKAPFFQKSLEWLLLLCPPTRKPRI
jgi:hypothetical protein